VTYVGVLHGLEGTLAVVALAPLLALAGYLIAAGGYALAGSWEALWGDAVALAGVALASGAVYASSYALARRFLPPLRWVEGSREPRERGGSRAPRRVLRLPWRVALPWRVSAPRREARRRRRRARSPL